jgi:pSer/pThr/pTyr-binding forkhead associated (FHA) protein
MPRAVENAFELRNLSHVSPTLDGEPGGAPLMIARLLGWMHNGTRLDASLDRPVRLGSAPEDDIRFPVDDVAKAHARIIQADGAYWIEDTGSRTGTAVNGERVSRARLSHLDVISLGARAEVIFIERGSGSMPAVPAAPMTAAIPQADLDWRTKIIWPGELAQLIPVDLKGGLTSKPGRGGAPETMFMPPQPIVPPPLTDDVQPAAGPRPVTVAVQPAPAKPASADIQSAARPQPAPAPQTIRGLRLVGTLGVFTLPIGRSLVGRSPDAAVRIDRRDVSREHAVIVVSPEGVTVADKGSGNGTRINAVAVKEARSIADGDRIAFGAYEFRAELLVNHVY